MELWLHNSATRRKERFEPLDPSHVRVYVCGPTVYDRAHIGNARAAVVFDVLVRLLRRLYPLVTYVRNITDVEDKILDAAKRSGEAIETITRRTTEWYHADMAALGNLPPDHEPRATAYIAQMVAMIERLVAAGHAYAAEGHVLFEVGSFDRYGALSNRSVEEQVAGARVEVAPWKRGAADFVLWKPSTPDQPGWESPWGRGRPGWHIECSAMSRSLLGEDFDIHGGGVDLIFPHHENEVAQSVCAHPGSSFARVWLHNGMLLVDGQKMSKSLGNFTTVEQVLALGPWAGEAFRLLLLKTHWREPLDYRKDALFEAWGELDRFYRAIELLQERGFAPVRIEGLGKAIAGPGDQWTYLCDDLNTSMVDVHLHALCDFVFDAKKRRRFADRFGGEAALLAGIHAELVEISQLTGLLTRDPGEWLRGGDIDEHRRVEEAIAARNVARAARDFATADEIRSSLLAANIQLEDQDGRTVWRKVPARPDR